MKIAVIYNDPEADRYQAMGESKAELGVIDEVKAVSQALAELKYSFILVPLRPPLEQVRKQLRSLDADVVFNLFEGFDGCPETEGQFAALLEELKVPFTGCPSSALTLALDKTRVKEILSGAGVGTPQYQVLAPDNPADFRLNFPCIVKPLADDSSHGISEESVVFDPDALEKQIRKISSLFGGRALVEEFVDGREFNAIVIGNQEPEVPAISEIVYSLPPGKPRILTFESKWEEKSPYFVNTRSVCPASISSQEQEEVRRTAKAAVKLTGCRGYARVDFRQDRNGNLKVLEVNPNPDISPGSGAALQTAAAGLTYSQFVEKIIRLALEPREVL